MIWKTNNTDYVTHAAIKALLFKEKLCSIKVAQRLKNKMSNRCPIPTKVHSSLSESSGAAE